MSDHLNWDSLNAYADDALLPEPRAAADTHLAECPACRAEQERLWRLLQQAAGAPAEVEPPAEAWLDVRRRITDAPWMPSVRSPRTVAPTSGAIGGAVSSMGRRRIAIAIPRLAAAALLLVAASSATTVLLLRRSPSADLTNPPPTSTQLVSLPSDVQSSERDYLHTAAALRRALDSERRRPDPGTIAVVERSLTVIEGAIAEARDALLRDPANAELRALWSRGHQQKLDLLRRATALLQTT
jgi:anti-sigma factor RsiW